MELELWYLIFIPVLFAAGWWARGLEARERSNDEATLPEVYARCVALLAGEKPEKATDALIQAIRLDPDLIELHHVLGNLFRRRGDFERAIRLHNHLVRREDIPEAERIQGLKELGEDYMSAGLFDRAEEVYHRLLKNPSEHLTALKALLKIYGIEHEWTHAVDIAERLQVQGDGDRSREVGHYYCELADGALKAKNYGLATDYLERAIEKSPTCVRAYIGLGDVHHALGQEQEALAAWRHVQENMPEYLPLVVGRIADALVVLESADQALAYLHEALAQSASIDVMHEAVSRIAKLSGTDEALKTVSDIVEKAPSLSAFAQLTSLRLNRDPDDENEKLLNKLLERHSKRLSRYQCSKCGFMASNFTWHCLGCGAWDSFPARRLEDRKGSR